MTVCKKKSEVHGALGKRREKKNGRCSSHFPFLSFSVSISLSPFLSISVLIGSLHILVPRVLSTPHHPNPAPSIQPNFFFCLFHFPFFLWTRSNFHSEIHLRDVVFFLQTLSSFLLFFAFYCLIRRSNDSPFLAKLSARPMILSEETEAVLTATRRGPDFWRL